MAAARDRRSIGGRGRVESTTGYQQYGAGQGKRWRNNGGSLRRVLHDLSSYRAEDHGDHSECRNHHLARQGYDRDRLELHSGQFRTYRVLAGQWSNLGLDRPERSIPRLAAEHLSVDRFPYQRDTDYLGHACAYLPTGIAQPERYIGCSVQLHPADKPCHTGCSRDGSDDHEAGREFPEPLQRIDGSPLGTALGRGSDTATARCGRSSAARDRSWSPGLRRPLGNHPDRCAAEWRVSLRARLPGYKPTWHNDDRQVVPEPR